MGSKTITIYVCDFCKSESVNACDYHLRILNSQWALHSAPNHRVCLDAYMCKRCKIEIDLIVAKLTWIEH